jgi:hypothetical protein
VLDAQKSFWRHSLVPLGDKAQVEVIQDRCTIFVKRTIGAKIILDAPDGMLR